MKSRLRIRALGLALSATMAAGLAVVADPATESADASTANVVCSTSYNSKGYTSSWKTIYPMVPVTSSTGTDCYLARYNTGSGVTAVQNGLAFTDYNLRVTPKQYEYAGILVGSSALAANNWGIDGSFGDKTYYALRAFQADYAIGVDGAFGNDSRQKMWMGENYLDNGYKYLVRGIHKTGSTWYYTSGSQRKVYAYN